MSDDIIYKTCIKCNSKKPSTSEYFYNHGKNGFRNTCKDCYLAANKKYVRDSIEKDEYSYRVRTRYDSYLQKDRKNGYKNDLTVDYLKQRLKEPCIYCGHHHELKMGLDRLDNNLGHTVDNTVVACAMCNHARNDHYTFDDMLVIGQGFAKFHSMKILNELIASISTIKIVDYTIEDFGDYVIWN